MIENILMKSFSLLNYFLLYFLVTSSTLNIVFPKDNNNLKVRYVYGDRYPISWLYAKKTTELNHIEFTDKKSEVAFDYQDIRTGDTYPSNKYMLWSYDHVYKDYINTLNDTILSIE
jgi:hypothetical protein